MATRKPTGPRACLQDHPNVQTIRFGGRYINLSAIVEATGFDIGYISYVFSGKRTPSTPNLRLIAKTMGMGVDDFLECLDIRLAEVRAKREKNIEVARQFKADREKTA